MAFQTSCESFYGYTSCKSSLLRCSWRISSWGEGHCINEGDGNDTKWTSTYRNHAHQCRDLNRRVHQGWNFRRCHLGIFQTGMVSIPYCSDWCFLSNFIELFYFCHYPADATLATLTRPTSNPLLLSYYTLLTLVYTQLMRNHDYPWLIREILYLKQLCWNTCERLAPMSELLFFGSSAHALSLF